MSKFEDFFGAGGLPVGMIVDSLGSLGPGYQALDGSILSKATFPKLSILYAQSFMKYSEIAVTANYYGALTSASSLAPMSNTMLFSDSVGSAAFQAQYIASGFYQGAIAITDDGGVSYKWSSILADAGTGTAVSGAAKVGNTWYVSLYATTAAKGIYKSTDLGGTWVQVNSSVTNGKLHASGTALILLASGGGQKSTDGGVSWTAIPTITGNASFEVNNTIIYYISSPGGSATYYYTTDGTTWITATAPGTLVSVIWDGVRYLATIYNSGFMYSSTNLASWVVASSLGGAIPAGASPTINYDPMSSILLQGGPGIGSNNLHFSADGGITWTLTTTADIQLLVSADVYISTSLMSMSGRLIQETKAYAAAFDSATQFVIPTRLDSNNFKRYVVAG